MMNLDFKKKEPLKSAKQPNSAILAIVLFVLLGVFSGCGNSDDDDSDKPDDAIALKTTRDDNGVWSIKGDAEESLYNVFEAMGYAVATDRLWQVEIYRRNARGTLSEIYGNFSKSMVVFYS